MTSGVTTMAVTTKTNNTSTTNDDKENTDAAAATTATATALKTVEPIEVGTRMTVSIPDTYSLRSFFSNQALLLSSPFWPLTLTSTNVMRPF